MRRLCMRAPGAVPMSGMPAQSMQQFIIDLITHWTFAVEIVFQHVQSSREEYVCGMRADHFLRFPSCPM
eukprot:3943979-Amphidinium_carterae.2